MNIARTSKRTEAELRHEYDALLAHSEAAVLVIDSAGVIQGANPTATQSFGLSEDLLVGAPLTPPLFPEALCAVVEAARAAPATVQRSEVHLPASGGQTLMVSVAPITGEKRKHRRFLVIAQDVTELRRLETIRRDFVANVSHELRTPLASIRAMAETLQAGAMQDSLVADRFLGTIVTEVERLTRISQDLLVLSDAESRSPEKVSFSLSKLLEDVVKRFEPQAQKAGITITTDVPSRIDLFANMDQLEAVIVNLIDNALKYTLTGGQVRVTASSKSDQISVHIADTGIGIKRKHLPRIFERFYRVDKARSRQSGGTGLGLAIVKHIVEAHGGQVTVESESDHGSTFTFILPANL